MWGVRVCIWFAWGVLVYVFVLLISVYNCFDLNSGGVCWCGGVGVCARVCVRVSRLGV